MIAKANRRINSHNSNGISLCVGDAARLPYADKSLDAVFGFGFLHHVQAWQDGLSEIVRVLKHGGVYFMEEYYPSLYQNFITKHIVAFQDTNLSLTHTFELKHMGILGVGVKADNQSIP
jgi:ubiquinone/menaquinone biosynthesis C-methylase UbiE